MQMIPINYQLVVLLAISVAGAHQVTKYTLNTSLFTMYCRNFTLSLPPGTPMRCAREALASTPYDDAFTVDGDHCILCKKAGLALEPGDVIFSGPKFISGMYINDPINRHQIQLKLC